MKLRNKQNSGVSEAVFDQRSGRFNQAMVGKLAQCTSAQDKANFLFVLAGLLGNYDSFTEEQHRLAVEAINFAWEQHANMSEECTGFVEENEFNVRMALFQRNLKEYVEQCASSDAAAYLFRLTMDLAGTIMIKSDMEGVNGALNCVEASWVDYRRRVVEAALDTP